MPFTLRIHPVAYFSMEVGLESAMPNYSGGLGVLAGDTLPAADLGLPMVGVTLLHRKGYFRQQLDNRGNQSEAPAIWEPEKLLEPQTPRVSVSIEGRSVRLRAWRYLVRGVSGRVVAVYFLDTALAENSAWDQTLTDCLYGGDLYYRLCQEVVPGMGGLAMLRAKDMIRRIFEAAAALGERLRVVYLSEYDMALAKLLCAGVDLWLNTPRKPQEASGTSSMKAALNGVPSLSILDGWWVEGHCEGVTGWSIGDDGPKDDPVAKATSLYDKLEYVILPMFFRRPLANASVMCRVIARNASFFNAQRMLGQYVRNAYLPTPMSSSSE